MKTMEEKITNHDSDLHKDKIGENTGEDTLLYKEANLKSGEKANSEQYASNKGKGPAGENL